jgi:hypothetical protein
VVGGVAGLALIAGIFFLLSRRALQNRIANMLQENPQKSPVDAGGIEQQMHEMPYSPGEDGSVKYGSSPNSGGYVPVGGDENIVQFEGPPREMPAN